MPKLPSPDESIGELLVRLIEDARVLVRAEVALYRSQVFAWIGKAKVIAALAVAALILVNGAAIALFVGLLLIFERRIGPIWATVIVVTATLLVAVLLGWLAARRVRKLIGERAVK